LATRASEEFDNLSDFIWKAPRLVESERTLELAKLERYFPDDVESREVRWRAESLKLDHVFPYLVAIGNLFALLSLFESYMLALCVELQSRTAVELNSIGGTGIRRLLKFLRKVGIAPDDLYLHQQVQVAIKIRNCLIHASGVLSWSHDNDDLRELQRTGAYLSPEHQSVRTKQGGEYVYLQPSALGDRLMVRNEYCHVLCSCLRTYFVALCDKADRVAMPVPRA
jgi:hypothetical protein